MTRRRVLIDECLPIQLHQWLDGFDARTVAFMGWAGRRDRELLEAARGVFDVVLTSDALMHRERDLVAYRLGLVVVPTNRKRTVQRLVPAIREALAAVAPGERRVVATSRAKEVT